jgi:hypothetical protein
LVKLIILNCTGISKGMIEKMRSSIKYIDHFDLDSVKFSTLELPNWNKKSSIFKLWKQKDVGLKACFWYKQNYKKWKFILNNIKYLNNLN